MTLDRIVAYLAVMNAVCFVAFAWDKYCARRGMRRVSERTLLLLAVIGGTLGAIAAQQGLRHKSYKEPFRSILWTIAGAHILLLAALAVPVSRAVVLEWVSAATGRSL